VTFILERIDAGAWQMLSSEIVRIEVHSMKGSERRRRVQALFAESDDTIALTENVVRRGAELVDLGFGAADALHVRRLSSWRLTYY
jgi:hypothetical protein